MLPYGVIKKDDDDRSFVVPPTYALVVKPLGNIDSSVSLQTPVDLRLTVAGCARLHASIRVAASDST